MDGVTNIDEGPKGSWKSRNCLSLGEYLSSWSFNGTWLTVARRFCMWAIIILRTVTNILAMAHNTLGSKIVSMICGVIIGIISFAFVFWCLTIIDRARGNRACWFCGLVVGRTHLDVFVIVNAILHLSLLASFWQLVLHTAVGFNIIWFALWVLIAFYGFLCTRAPLSV
ncbi:hypothetical protein N8I77_003642 [Diaporthe amygdali]|uniref:Uncharacterized protein n=1 Tax=Phomopsis amygdali TaxID=1214568 RepID=A0AAD9SKE5_PHOAM|nr:hypothetical protein N8I77_003642 [Diaporthe amygdali]